MSNSSSNTSSGGRSGRGRGSHNKRGRRPFTRPIPKSLSFAELQAYFAACPTCGYFLTSYRVLHGVEALEQAGQEINDGWLTLVWDLPTRELLYRTYEMRTDIELLHIESTCRDCQRKIVFDQGEAPAESESQPEPESEGEGEGEDKPSEDAVQPLTFRMRVS